MRIAALLLVALFCCGCAKERAQQAADTRAGIAAAKAHCDPIGQAILAGVDARLPAVADVNSADWPAPAMKPEEIEADPKKYTEAAPPEPKRWGGKLIAAIGVASTVALWLVGRLAPMLPGAGTLVGGIANTAYALLAPKPVRQLDAARDVLHEYAPTIQAALSQYPGQISGKLTQAVGLLAGPSVVAAASTTSPPTVTIA